jgi:hypothetical protein
LKLWMKITNSLKWYKQCKMSMAIWYYFNPQLAHASLWWMRNVWIDTYLLVGQYACNQRLCQFLMGTCLLYGLAHTYWWVNMFICHWMDLVENFKWFKCCRNPFFKNMKYNLKYYNSIWCVVFFKIKPTWNYSILYEWDSGSSMNYHRFGIHLL